MKLELRKIYVSWMESCIGVFLGAVGGALAVHVWTLSLLAQSYLPFKMLCHNVTGICLSNSVGISSALFDTE
jgi:hypothetical protein